MAHLRVIARPIPEAYMQVNSVRRLGKVLKSLKVSHAFVITDAGLVKAGVAEKVIGVVSKAGIKSTLFAEVIPNPTVEVVHEGARRLSKLVSTASLNQESVAVVTLGGGSSMDAGKAIAMLAGQGPNASILDYVICPELDEDGEEVDRRTLVPKKIADSRLVPPVIAIPTTSGTASETNGASVITDTSDPLKHRKLICISDAARAHMILLDPALTVGVPRYPTATCGMDVLTHAIEAFTSSMANPYSSSIAKGAIAIVAKHLRNVVENPQDIESRAQMHLASHMAGIAFNMASLGIVHAMGHPLSALYNKAHGQTLATMLPHLMHFNLDACAQKYAEIAKIFGVYDTHKTDEANGFAAINAITQLSIDIGTAKSIRELGGSEEDIPTLVRQALTDLSMLTTPVGPTADEVRELLQSGGALPSSNGLYSATVAEQTVNLMGITTKSEVIIPCGPPLLDQVYR